MDVAKPHAALSPTLDVELLVELSRSTEPRTGRELARRLGRSETGVRHAFDHLVEHGLVHRARAGQAYIYSLNRDHLLAPIVEQIAGARNELIRRLRELITAWNPAPLHVSVFGSAARGDGDTGSDVDFFIVRPKGVDADDQPWNEQVNDLAELVRAWTGNHAGVAEVGEEELAELRKERRSVLNDIRSDAIDLGGKKAREILRSR
jgi:predicted transcriptional regulator